MADGGGVVKRAGRGSLGGAPDVRRATGGRLIVVTCADMGRLDLVLRAVVRRLSKASRAVLAEPVATRALPAGSGSIVSRNAFGAMHAGGCMVFAWTEGTRSFGYDAALFAKLAAGEHVVVGVPASGGLAATARELWHDVCVIRLEPGTETLRTSLSPQACLSRVAGPVIAGTRLGQILAQSADIRLIDHGDLTLAVRALTEALEALVPLAAVLEPASATTRIVQAGGAGALPNRPHAASTRPPRQSRRTALAGGRVGRSQSRAGLPT